LDKGKERRYIVNNEWWESSKIIGYCALEDAYAVGIGKKPKKRLLSSAAMNRLDSVDENCDASTSKKSRNEDSAISSFLVDVSAVVGERSFAQAQDAGNKPPGQFSRAASCPNGAEYAKIDRSVSGPPITTAEVSDVTGAFSKNQTAILRMVVYDGFIEVGKIVQGGQIEHRGLIALKDVRRVADITGCGGDVQIFALTIRHSTNGDNTMVFQFRKSGYASDAPLPITEQKDTFLEVLRDAVQKSSGRDIAVEDHESSQCEDFAEFDEFYAAVRNGVRLARSGPVRRSIRIARRSSSNFFRSVSEVVGDLKRRSNRLEPPPPPTEQA